MANGKKRGLRIAGKILWFLLSLVLLTVLGLVLIIGQPQKKEDPEALPQPLLTASPAVTIQREIEFRTLLDIRGDEYIPLRDNEEIQSRDIRAFPEFYILL